MPPSMWAPGFTLKVIGIPSYQPPYGATEEWLTKMQSKLSQVIACMCDMPDEEWGGVLFSSSIHDGLLSCIPVKEHELKNRLQSPFDQAQQAGLFSCRGSARHPATSGWTMQD